VRARPGYFSNESVEILKEWLEGNLNHPYVKKSEVNALELKSGLSKKQIMGWCTNVRRRRLTVVTDKQGLRQLITQNNPEKKRKQNKSGARVPIILYNSEGGNSDTNSTDTFSQGLFVPSYMAQNNIVSRQFDNYKEIN